MVVVYVGRFGGTLCERGAALERLVVDRRLVYPVVTVLDCRGSLIVGVSTGVLCTQEIKYLMKRYVSYFILILIIIKGYELLKPNDIAWQYPEMKWYSEFGWLHLKINYYWVMSEHYDNKKWETIERKKRF